MLMSLFTRVLPLIVITATVTLAAIASQTPTAVIYNDQEASSVSQTTLIDMLTATLRQEGYQVQLATSNDITRGTLKEQQISLLVLPDAPELPADLIQPIESYLRTGGNLLSLGGAGWSHARMRLANGKMATVEQVDQLRAAIPVSHAIFDNPLTGWKRESDQMGKPSNIETTASGAPDASPVLHVTISDFREWDTYTHAIDAKAMPISPNEQLTSFWAKGDTATQSLVIEWDERDGGRWIASQPISTKWKRYFLPLDRFKPWFCSPAQVAQGLHPENFARISFGLAVSHAQIPPGRHEFWVAGIGVTPDVVDKQAPANLPTIETLSPGYKFYSISTPVKLQADTADSSAVVAPNYLGSLSAPQPRPSGGGFMKKRTVRWQPILTALDQRNGEWRGCPGVALIHSQSDPQSPGGVWETITIADPDFYKLAGKTLISSFAHRLRTGLFLNEGGADASTYFPGDTVTLGAAYERIVNCDPIAGRNVVEIKVSDSFGNKLYDRSWPVDLTATTQNTVADKWTPSSWPEQGYTVTTTLLHDGKPIDTLQHRIYAYAASNPPSFVTIGDDGHFHKDGKIWRIIGVNYMPSSGIGLNDGNQFEYWLDKQPYDSEIVERDLRHIAECGFNEISAFIYVRSLPSRNLLDLLRLARKYNLKVNLGLRPGMPHSFVAKDLIGIIDTYRLRNDDTVFAYDIAWEPEFGHYARRCKMDKEWAAWVEKKYGTIDNGKAAWKFEPPFVNGKLTGPSDDQVSASSGDFAAMVADYRRFLSDWLEQNYGAARASLRAADPNHWVSFRMSDAGSGVVDQRLLPYELVGLDKAVDFYSPEGYAIPRGEQGAKAAAFTVAYAHSVAPKLPVVWAEAGMQVWDRATGQPSAQMFLMQADYYAEFLKSLRLTGGDGIVFWWYPGGFRVGENSDFGLFEPDGTPRPSARLIQSEAPSYLALPAQAAPSKWLDFDRFAHPNGLRGTYLDLADSYWAALNAGENVGLRMKNRE